MIRIARGSLLLGLAAMVLFASGCGGGGASGDGPGGEAPPDVAVDLVVRWITPTNGQEVLTDLSDPGLGGALTLNFSERLNPTAVIDDQNVFNQLTSDVNILNSGFYRVPGVPVIGGSLGNVLTFFPSGGSLPNGQYTVTVTRDVTNYEGGQLNGGLFDFRSSFTVGTDQFKPKIRNTYPAHAQTDVSKTSDVIVTFNESLNPATVSAATFQVLDNSQAPPAPVNGILRTARDDFEIIFTPDPANPFPPNATITVIVGGGIADIHGNVFDWDETDGTTAPEPDLFSFSFDTVKEQPLPVNPLTADPLGTPPDASIYYATLSKIGVIAERDFFANTAVLSGWGTASGGPNPIPNSERPAGRPDEMVVDPRFSAVDGHSWIYYIDLGARAVGIYASRNSLIVHRWRDLPDPRGLAIQPNGLTLFVTNFSADSLSFMDIGSATVGDGAATDVVKNLSKLGNPNDANALGTRIDLPVGRGPLGAAHAPDASLCFVANNIDNSCTLVNTSTAVVNTTFPIGTSPQDVAATFNFPGIGRFAFITCLGGGTDDNGSVSLYWDRPNGLQANVTGFQNPKGCIYDRGANAWIANSGGNTTSRLTLAFAGGGFAATILPQISATVKVGKNPTSVTMEPISLFFGAPTRSIITADRGSSQVSFVDAGVPSRPTYALMIPGVHEVASYFDQ